jgi:hypothetical protein
MRLNAIPHKTARMTIPRFDRCVPGNSSRKIPTGMNIAIFSVSSSNRPDGAEANGQMPRRKVGSDGAMQNETATTSPQSGANNTSQIKRGEYFSEDAFVQ